MLFYPYFNSLTFIHVSDTYIICSMNESMHQCMITITTIICNYILSYYIATSERVNYD